MRSRGPFSYGFGLNLAARGLPSGIITDPRVGYMTLFITDPRPGYEGRFVTNPQGYSS